VIMSYQLGSAGLDGQPALYADQRNDDGRSHSRGIVASLVGVVLTGVFAGGLWFAYQQGLRHGGAMTGAADVPLIRADERPTKIKPEKPGGMEVPDRDKLIYTQKRGSVEHLLPPPEKPMPRPGGVSANASSDAHQPQSGTAPAALAQPLQPAGKPPLKPAAPTTGLPTAPTVAKSGATRIQLGSVRSEEAARQEWERIRRANPDLLATLSAAPVRADLGDKGVYYRVLTTPVADADRICGELKQRNVGCVIAR